LRVGMLTELRVQGGKLSEQSRIFRVGRDGDEAGG
jgi:hypothetical protein